MSIEDEHLIPMVWFNECQVCGRGSMTAICSDFCYGVRVEWTAGKYGQVTLKEAYTMAKEAAEVSLMCVGDLLSGGEGLQ